MLYYSQIPYNNLTQVYGTQPNSLLNRNYIKTPPISSLSLDFINDIKLLRRLDKQAKWSGNEARLACGDICDTSMEGEPAKYYPYIYKHVNCLAMMSKLKANPSRHSSNNILNLDQNSNSDRVWPPHLKPPPEMLDEFTMRGEMPLDKYEYHMERQAGLRRSKPITVEEIGFKIMRRAKRVGMSSYGVAVEDLLQVALTKYNFSIVNKMGLDFGSSRNTWITALALLNGAAGMFMVDYMAVVSQNPKIETKTPDGLYQYWHDVVGGKSHSISSPFSADISLLKVNSMYTSKNLITEDDYETNYNRVVDLLAVNYKNLFDFAISYSSVEHSGLGRYEEELNPFGDLEAVSQIWCLLNPKGILFLNVPYYKKGSKLVWNAHRIYGPNRMQHLTANWKVIDRLDVCEMTKGTYCERREQMMSVLWVLQKV
ncbi:unnamed protein product [Gordionus sp. m RMFG-2023]